MLQRKQICIAWIFIGISFFVTNAWSATPPSRDSLFQIWENTNLPDTTRMEAMAEMILHHYQANILDSAMHFSQQLFDMAEQLENKYYIAYGQYLLGNSALSMGLYLEAKEQHEKALAYWQEIGDKQKQLGSYNSLGILNKEFGQFDIALELLEKGMDLTLEVKDSSHIIGNLINIAAIFEAQGSLLKSLEYNLWALELIHRYQNPRHEAVCQNNLGNNYKDLGDVNKSAQHYYECLKLYESAENPWGMVTTYSNLALLHINDKSYSKAAEYLDKALILAESVDFYEGMAMTYANTGALKEAQQEYEAAAEAFKQCLKIVEESGMINRVPFVQLELGSIYLQSQNLAEAEKYINEGLANSEELGFGQFILSGNLYKCRLLIEQKKWQEAESYGMKGYNQAKANQDLSFQSDFAAQLVIIYKQLGRSAEALQMFETKELLNDSLRNEETTRELIQQEYQYDYERKTYQDSLANVAAFEQKNADLRRRSLINRFLWAILLIVAIFAGILINRYRYIQKQRLSIQEAKERAEAEKEKAEAANAKLLEIDQSKSRFFTNISHEFRTPLTVISGMAEQLSEDGRVKQLIQRNTRHLLQLINQILDLRKLESGSLPTRYIQSDVVKYLKYVLESFHSMAEQKALQLFFEATEETIIVDYDPEKLLRILTNLLSNAIKFTDSGGRVQLSVSSHPNQDNPVYRFSVSDTGLGIATGKLPYIFDRFYQVDDEASKLGEGTGIGLALTKELVELLNGSIQVKSLEDEGTTFTVELPYTQQAILVQDAMEETAAVMPIAAAFSTEAIKNRTQYADDNLPSLLIVEDNPDVMEYLITCLERDYQLTFAYDGQDGFEKALELIPDIIVSDVMMPRMDGYTLCDTLKKEERTSHIPIVLLTAKADIDSRITGLERGADAYLAKPFDQRELSVQLKNLLALRQQLHARYSSLAPLTPTEDTAIQQEDEFIIKLREIFDAHIDDTQFDLNALSKAMLMSRTHFGRKVKALTGRTPAIYLRSIRLQKARTLLLTTSLSIKEIAYDVGFSNQGYFSNSYKEEFGEYPTVTRENQQT
ncbi:MAG: tetratricopeptide repeat protein [Chitinophagales bacterium]|nr:tetratricopeptide repeat protein [Chitinophagales bacterium]